ncbi:Ig-like domain repeat protein [Methanobrevibacter sp.]|uniref:Ig-like domain repeat protein n=1 Tax=Methanobrevibacter sp. TaxID=66852 RepID=UPI00388FA85C
MFNSKNKKILFLLVVFITLLLIPSSFAQDLSVNDADNTLTADGNVVYVSTTGNDGGNGSQSNPFNSVSAAVDAFDSTVYSNIYIENGNYNITNQIVINKDITIIGESSDGVILNANGQSTIFKIDGKSDILLKSLTFANAYDKSATQYSGSAIFVESSVNGLLIDDCIFKNNKNGTVAVYSSWLTSGEITIQNSVFSGNEKTHRSWDQGSAISIGRSFNLNVINTTFEDNTAAPIHLYNNAPSAVFDNCKFIRNKADDYSAIYAHDAGHMTIINSEFRGNVINDEEGYLIYDSASSYKKFNLTLGNNIIENNTPNTIYTSDNINVIYLENNARLEANDVSMLEGQDKSFTVKLIDDEGNPIADKEIIITLTNYYNEVFTFNPVTNASGIATVNLKNQKFGKYRTVSVFNGDGKYDSCNITNTIAISTEADYNMIFNPDYVKMVEGSSFNVTGIITDNYGEPEKILDGYSYEIRWLNHNGNISVINGNAYKVVGYEFVFDLSRCHLVTQNELYYVNFTITRADYDYTVTVTGSLPVDLSRDMPPIDPGIDVIWVSVDGSDETGDGTESNPIKSVQMGLYVNTMLGGGKTIHVKEGVYDISIYTLTDKVTIVGEGSKTILRQDNGRLGMFSIEKANTARFINLTFTNGYATPVPGSLITATEHSTVYIDGCEFYDNVAIRGGAIAIDSSNVYVTNSNFHNNTARLQASQGGAIWATSGVLQITNTVFEDNEATLGGAIYVSYDADTYISNCTFINNTAVATTLTYGGGGAIFSQSSIGTVIENSSFIGNYAEIDGGAIYVYGGLTDITGSYFYDNNVGFGTDKGSTIHLLPLASPITFNIDYSILFTEDDYNKVIYVEEIEDDNESSFSFENNYWGGQQKGFVSVNKAVEKWVIMDADRDTSVIHKGDVINITAKFVSTDINGTIYNLDESVHDLLIYLSPDIGEVNPKTIVLHKNLAEFKYYANEIGSEYINFTSDYARHYVYSFKVIDSEKIDVNANITVSPGKTTTIDVEVPNDLENNVTINVDGADNSIKAQNGHAIMSLDVIPGNHSLVVSYVGDDKYKGFVNESSFFLDKDASEVFINIENITFGDLLIVNVNVTEGATGSVVVTINKKDYVIELNNSKGSKAIPNIEAGNHTAYANYTGDSYFKSSIANTTFSVAEVIPITTIYVSTKGNDTSGDGSQENPYATISKALDRNNALGGNKTIIVDEGNYVLNRYSLVDSVYILANGDVLVYSDANTNHLYIGGDVDVTLEGLTFAGGNGFTAGSIDMGSSANNSAKNLTINKCNFIANKGPIGAIVSYANTKITQTNFINNTATGNSGSVQGIINIRDNTADISYSNFIGNKMANNLMIYSTVEGNAKYNFWGNNTKPGDDAVSSLLNKDAWVILSPSINDTEIVLKHDFTISVEFKSTSDGKTLNDLDEFMPDVDVSLTAEVGQLSPEDITIAENIGESKYNVYVLNNDLVSVYVADVNVANLTIEVYIPEEDKIYVDVEGNDSNYGTYDSPLKTIAAAINQNKLAGGNKTIVVGDGLFTEGDLIIDDIVNIIGNGSSTIKTNSLTINANTSITSLNFADSKINHNSGDLSIYNSAFENTKLTSSGDNLEVYSSEFIGEGISTSAETLIDDTTFANISSKALEIKNDAIISNSKFENNNLAIDVAEGDVDVIGNEFIKNNDIINADSKTSINNNKFEDNQGVIYIFASSELTNNQFSGETVKVADSLNSKNNTDVKYELSDGSISNAIITYLDGKTIKVDGGLVALNATVTDDMGNIIGGGNLEFTVNGIKVGEANVTNGSATFNWRFESGEYTISGASSDFPKAKVTPAVLRVNIVNYWFINEVGYETLAEAVEAAVDGDVIKGVPGDYIINEIEVGHRYRAPEPWTITKNITITSLNETPITLEGNGGRLFFVDTGSELTLKNLILANCHKEGDVGFGGAIDVFFDAQLNIDNCTLENNSADQGGAIYAIGGVNIVNSKFNNNVAGLIGGAIFKDFTGDLVIENTTFTNSFASSFGGAIHLLGDNDTDNYIINCLFDSNTGFRGGAVYAGSANLTVIGSNFTSNKALRVHTDYEDEEAIGGAFYNYYANAFFYDSNFINNVAQDCGGAMELDNTVTSIGPYIDPTITIYFTGIDNCTFINNTADDGGAIYMGVSGCPFVLISNSLFEQNTAKYNSAGIGNVAGFLSLENTTFRKNTAGMDNLIYVYGTDDLYNEYDSYIFANNCTFENNNVNLDIEVTNMYSFGEIVDSTFIGEQTVLLNRGFVNVTSTEIKDSRNPSKYVINNFGQLGLENNTFDNPLYSDVYITTPTYLVILDNETYTVAIGAEYTLTAVFLDDNGNIIEGADLVFIVDGAEINATLANHLYTAYYTVTEGTHLIDANYSYSGFENLTIQTAIIKAVEPASMNVTAPEIREGENLTIDVTLPSDATGNVSVDVDGKTYTSDIENGKASVTVPDLKAGQYDAEVTYSGNDKYPESSKTVKLTVKEAQIDPKMEIKADNITEGEDLTVDVTLPSDATGNVTVSVDGKNYTKELVNGSATITVSDLDVGNHSVDITYSGDENYAPSAKSINVDVARDMSDKVTALDVTKYYSGSERFVVKVTDCDDNPLANKAVKITINGVDYDRTTNANGTTSIALGLNSGVYNVTVIAVNQTVNSVVTILPTVNGSDVVKVFRNGTHYYATFKDNMGNYLPDGSMVRFNINGVFYDRYVRGNEGLAKLNINLEQGTYIITAMNLKTGEMTANNITVISRIIENNDLTKYYRNASQYTVKLIGDDGKSVGAGENVTFNINGVFYTRTTNASGIAKLNINLPPNDYIITAEYNGCRVANNIKVLPVLSAQDITMSYRDGTKFEAKLLDGQGKPYANQEITFNINGLFYQRTTDIDGIARLNINLMSGQYIITSSYNGCNVANTITIR